MNWNKIEGSWKQLKGEVKQRWGKLTDNDLTVIAGKRDELVGKLQQHYGYAKEEAKRQVDDFANTCSCSSSDSDRPSAV